MTVSDTQAVDLLEAMVRTPSLCGEEDAVADLLCRAMERFGFTARRDEVGNVVGTIGPAHGARSVVLLGHMDTVPGSISVERRDGALYGRGAVDAKGPLATAMVAAARAASDTGVRITVIGAVQEEGPSVGARHLLSGPRPDFLVIAEPSGWEAIVLGYKGSQRFTVRITQPATHTAVPEATASERAVRFWVDLTAWCHARTPDASTEFNRLSPTLIAMHSESDGLRDTATLHVGLRLQPGEDVDEVRQAVRALLPAAGFDFNPGEPAVLAPKTTPLVSAFLRSIRTEDGTPRFKVKTGTSDMNVVGPVWGCPMVAYGPGDSRLDHTPDEHIVIDDYLRAIQVLTRVLVELPS